MEPGSTPRAGPRSFDPSPDSRLWSHRDQSDRPFPSLLFNWAEGGKTPPLALLERLGYRLVLFPISTLLAATRAIRGVLAGIRSGGTPAAVMDRLVPFDEFLDFIGLPEIRDLER
jgi:2-methylisocitrate lyase-like PEP mutase family enzyme